MPDVRRGLLHLLTVLSLLLFVATVVLWVRSYGAGHWVRLHRMPEAEPGQGPPMVTDCRASVDFGTLSVLTTRGPGETDWAYVLATAGGRPRVNWWSRGTELPSDKLFFQACSDPPAIWNRAGFAYLHTNYAQARYRPTRRVVAVVVPLWLAAVVFEALPVVRGYRRLRYGGRRRECLCPACGYDLTGNVSGVCPECGGQVAPAGKAGATK